MSLTRRIVAVLIGVVGLGVLQAAHGADAVRGKALFANTNGSPQSCASAACHSGFPAVKRNSISKGSNPSAILNAISGNTGGMRILAALRQRHRCRRHRGLHRQSCGRRWRCGDRAVCNQSHIRLAVTRHHERSADRDGQQYRNCRTESHRADVRRRCQRRICAGWDVPGRRERRRGRQLFAAGDVHSRCVGRPQCNPDDLAQCTERNLDADSGRDRGARAGCRERDADNTELHADDQYDVAGPGRDRQKRRRTAAHPVGDRDRRDQAQPNSQPEPHQPARSGLSSTPMQAAMCS